MRTNIAVLMRPLIMIVYCTHMQGATCRVHRSVSGQCTAHAIVCAVSAQCQGGARARTRLTHSTASTAY